mgnify:CR=1 FL=1
MKTPTKSEALKAISYLLDSQRRENDLESADQAKIVISYIQQNDLAKNEMLNALEEIAESSRIVGDGPTQEACNKVIWKVKGEIG